MKPTAEYYLPYFQKYFVRLLPLLWLRRPGSFRMRRLLIDDSLQGKILRRWLFLYRFVQARRRIGAINRLGPILEKFFDDEWIAGVSVALRFLPGAEDREIRVQWTKTKHLLRLRWLPWRKQGCTAHWDAPVTVAITKKSRGEEPKTVRYMSFFLQGDRIYIVQLQGAPSIHTPKGLTDWAERFVKGCMEFARQENFRVVNLARANSLYSYHNPETLPSLTPTDRELALKSIRASFEKHYDETGRNLGICSWRILAQLEKPCIFRLIGNVKRKWYNFFNRKRVASKPTSELFVRSERCALPHNFKTLFSENFFRGRQRFSVRRQHDWAASK